MDNRNNIIIGGIVVVILLIGIVWYVGYRDENPQQLNVPGERQQVTNDAQDLEFVYYGGVDGYTLLESPDGATLGEQNLLKAYTLVSTEAYNANNQSTTGIGQEIPAITVLVFAEESQATTTVTSVEDSATTSASTTDALVAERPSLETWAQSHGGYTAYGLKTGDVEQVRVDNVSAIRFISEGALTSETYVVNYRGKYYVFIGQYASEGDDIRTAFLKLLSEVYFL